MRLFIAPYKMGSESAKLLARRLGVLRVKGTKSFRRSDVVLNWGNSSIDIRGGRVLNSPTAIRAATNKLTTFQALKARGVPTVEWTTDRMVADGWLDTDVVMARTMLNSSKGRGIVVLEPDSVIINAPLYTKYMRAHEYRIHVFKGRVIDMQKKKRRIQSNTNDYIKNLDNGWVFCRESVTANYNVYQVAINAVAALGLDFGAVDILYRERENKVAVLEINTSPGMTEDGTTLSKYAEAVRNAIF